MDDDTIQQADPHRGISRRTVLVAGVAAGGLAIGAGRPLVAHAATGGSGSTGGSGRQVSIGDFETDLDGWTAAVGGPKGTSVDYRFERTDTRAKVGSYSAHLWADFHGGYNARAIRSLGDLGLDQLPRPTLDAVSFWVYADNVTSLFLWIVDAANQIHQQTLTVTAGGWVSVRVSSFTSGKDYKTFGGANDGGWHGPAKRMQLLIPTAHRTDRTKPAQIWLDDVVAELTPTGPLSVTQDALGNVFTDQGDVAVTLTAASGTAALTARDLWGNVIDTKSVSVQDYQKVPIHVGSPGYFQLDVKSTSQGDSVDLKTPLALLPGREHPGAGSSAFGVGTHLGWASWGTEMMPLVELSGVSEIRDSIPWSKVEPTSGTYTFDYGAEFMRELKADGISPLLNVHGPNRNYDSGLTPYTPEAIAAFVTYAQKLLQHYGQQMRWVEVWNEYNGGFSDGPGKKSVDNYYTILKATYQGVKDLRPDVTVVAPATASVPMGWLEDLFTLGALDYMDAVSVHPYRWPVPPESLAQQMGQLEALIKRYNGGKPKPIWITEIGWPTGSAYGTTERQQAEYLARTYALALSAGVQKIFWYAFMNNGIDRSDKQDNFGIIRYATDPVGRYTPKPAYVAYSVVTRQLDGTTYVKDDDDLPDGVRSCVFRDSTGNPTRVMWSPGKRQDVTLDVDQPVEVTDLTGRSAHYGARGKVSLTLGDDVVYVTGKVRKIASGAPIALSAAPTAAVGDDVPVTLTVDATGSSHPVPALFDVVGRVRPVSMHAPAGKRVEQTITVPGLGRLGPRTVIADARIRGRRAARLVADADVRSAITVQVTPDVAVDPLTTALIVEVANNSASTARTVNTVSWAVGDNIDSTTPGTSVAPGTSTRIRVPLSGLSSWTPYDASVTVEVSGLDPFDWQDRVTFDPVLTRSITVDGTLDGGVAGSPGIDLSTDGQWKQSKSSQEQYGGPADAGGLMWLFHDQESLFLVAKITDNVFSQTHTGGKTWQGDSIQFAMVSGPPVNTGQTAYRYALALTPDGPQLNRDLAPAGVDLGLVTDANVAITRSGADTVYEVSLPWKETPLTPSTGLFAFTMLYNDNDGDGRKGYLQWGSGLGSGHVDPGQFNACQLMTS